MNEILEEGDIEIRLKKIKLRRERNRGRSKENMAELKDSGEGVNKSER